MFASTVYARILVFLYPKNIDKVVFAKGEYQNHCIAVTLIMAKARLAQTKTESVSRFELAACLIDTRLRFTFAQAFDIFILDSFN